MRKGPQKERTTRQKALALLSGILQLALLIAALWDIRRRSDEEINGGKRMWKAIVFINYVGPIAYFIFGRKR